MAMASTSLRSSSVTLENIDDYLAPSQACINPAFQPTTKLGGDDNGGDATGKAITGTEPASSTNVVVPRRRRRIVRKRIISSTDGTEPSERATTRGLGTEPISPLQQSIPKQEEGEKKTKKAVKASMADCLACSGCVTTAETVMMEERHSLKSLRNRLLSSSSSGGRERPRIVTISPNSWADMCRHWNLKYKFESGDHDEARGKNECDYHNFYFSRFTTLLWKMLSVKVVMDGNIPLQWTWIDEAQEFCQAYKKTLETSSEEGNLQRASSNPPPLPSIAIDSSKTLYYKSDGTSEIRNNSKRPAAILPLISGSCPALVCLVEKTLTQLVPNLSQTISPMSLAGIILNHYGDNDENDKLSSHKVDTNSVLSTNDETPNIVRKNRWDHWAIMPCHDKKLEASRKDFANESKEQAVDLVISTQECVELVEEWIQSQQNQNHDQSQAHLGLISSLSVANHLATLPPSTVSTDVLEPKDFLEKTSPYYVNEESTPLLLTTPTIIREGVNTKAATTTAKLQNHQMAFSSGGHANFMFMYAAKKLFGYTFDDSDGDGDDHGTGRGVKWQAASLAAKNVRSARLGKLLKQHYYETKLYRYQDGSYGIAPVVSENEESSKLVLHFAVAHGMQTMQRALKQVVERPIGNTGNACSTRTLHYLEAMACPHGCVNGGGSFRSTSSFSTNQKSSTSVNLTRETPSETRERVRSTLGHLEVPNLAKLNTIKIPIESREIGPLPRTEYHVVPPMNYTTGAVAGESVENMIW